MINREIDSVNSVICVRFSPGFLPTYLLPRFLSTSLRKAVVLKDAVSEKPCLPVGSTTIVENSPVGTVKADVDSRDSDALVG